jgi:hypothetical protein
MAFGDLGDPVTVAVIAIAAVLACALVLYAMRRRPVKSLKAPKPVELESSSAALPFKISKSVQASDALHAKDELRILELEREILSDALRRLYEAHAEGKISEEERERLASAYKARMMAVKESIAKDETIVALHELESMQEDLMRLFSERFGELTSKVEELRSKIEVKPIKEVKVQLPTPSPAEEDIEEGEEGEKPKKRKKPPEKPSPKSEAEKRIEEIRNEVEKVLNKLGQMEIET